MDSFTTGHQVLNKLSLLVALSVLGLAAATAYDAGHKSGGVCTSQGGRFPKYALEGQAPRKAGKGPSDLTLCRVYRKKTCCTSVQTRAGLVSLARLTSSGEASKECIELWEVLECSICDPQVGVKPGPPLLCPSFCDSLFEACGKAFFSADPSTEVLVPCKDTVCARGREWASTAREFCKLAGFSVLTPQEQQQRAPACFDGSLTQVGSDSLFETRRPTHTHGHRSGYLSYLRKWVSMLTSGDNISWAVGGLVLTAGVCHYIWFRGRRPKNRHELAAIRAKTLQHRQPRVDGSPRALGKGTKKGF